MQKKCIPKHEYLFTLCTHRHTCTHVHIHKHTHSRFVGRMVSEEIVLVVYVR